jgi:hypothetical protein
MPTPIKIASRLDPIKPSITLAVTAKAAKLKADGIDIVSFGAGEPDFDTPAHIKDAARAALDKLDVWRVRNYAGAIAAQEGQELRWVDPRKLAASDLLPADQPIIDALSPHQGVLLEKRPREK